MKRLQLSSIAIALMALSAAAAAQTQTATEVGKITVTGEGDKLGTDRKSTRLNSVTSLSRMPSSA